MWVLAFWINPSMRRKEMGKTRERKMPRCTSMVRLFASFPTLEFMCLVVFKSFAIVFPLAKLLTFNIVTLVVGPIALLLLFLCERIILAPRAESAEFETDSSPVPSDSHGISWLHTIWRHAKFWIVLAVVIGMQLLLTWAYIRLNPFVCYYFFDDVGTN